MFIHPAKILHLMKIKIMELAVLLDRIVSNDAWHMRWLNTLSFMENAGARKISACEDVEDVTIVQLKHAAEEHRHAYYLKKQLNKIEPGYCRTYNKSELLCAVSTMQYLNRLDVFSCKYLKEQFKIEGQKLKFAAYLFVTYAIEVRADILYPVYQEVLSFYKHRVHVKSIIVEEAGHLEEMIGMLELFDSNWQLHAQKIIEFENQMFSHWIHGIAKELNSCITI